MRRQAVALVGDQAEAQQTFIAGLLEHALLIEHARRAYLALLRRRGWTGALYEAAAEDSLSTVLRTPFRRTEELLAWRPAKGSLATWWAQQALFEFNNDGRRFAERTQGLRRGSDERLHFVIDTELDEHGFPWPSTLVDEGADPAERYEQAADDAALRSALVQDGETEHLALLQHWLAEDALHATEPVCLNTGQVQLRWRYGA